LDFAVRFSLATSLWSWFTLVWCNTGCYYWPPTDATLGHCSIAGSLALYLVTDSSYGHWTRFWLLTTHLALYLWISISPASTWSPGLVHGISFLDSTLTWIYWGKSYILILSKDLLCCCWLQIGKWQKWRWRW
jgi:hypothetical protein